MLRVITLNLNGIRAAAKKGFFSWLEQQNADVVCVQETKAQQENLTDSLFRPAGYHRYFSDAIKPGYSGVGIYCRQQPAQVVHSFGWSLADQEGRYVKASWNDLHIISLYMPSGTSGEQRQAVKYEFMQHFYQHLEEMRSQQQQFIICGDWNIAHKIIDIKNWRGNQKNSGFLPEERAWMDKLLNSDNWVDAFRVVNQEAEQYTWWSNRGQAWAKNVGWRIDYQIVSSGLKNKVKSAAICKEQRFSDHAPVIVDFSIDD